MLRNIIVCVAFVVGGLTYLFFGVGFLKENPARFRPGG